MRLIDLDKVVKSLTHSIRRSTTVASYVLASAISRIAVLPTIDIVQCKDCKFWGEKQEHYCGAIDDPYMLETDADDFCSWGEKR